MSIQHVLVTGASTGIGRATALRLASHGWTVFAGVRSDEAADGLTAEGPAIRPIRLDVTDDEQVESALAEVADAVDGDGLAGLVNNAGTALGGPIEYLPLQAWRDQLAVNVVGQVAVTCAALPLLRRHQGPQGRRGRIVFMGSNSGRVAAPMMGPYVASKFALEGLADSLRLELDGSGVAVVLLEPGAVSTPIWDKGRSQVDELARSLPPEAIDRYRDLMEATESAIESQDRVGVDPDQVAATVERVLVARRPRARYPVGNDARVGILASRLLPDRAKDFAVRRFLKL